MAPFGKVLKKIRLELGFRHGKHFYEELAKKAAPNFNYSYYVRIESGKVRPSPAVVQMLAGFVGQPMGDRLILSYCDVLFPGHPHLFQEIVTPEAFLPEDAGGGADRITLEKQRLLNPMQLAALGKSQAHYMLFLILTLSRAPVSMAALEKLLPSSRLHTIIKDLAAARLSYEQAGMVAPTSREIRFPPADSPDLQGLYAKFSAWDYEFAQSHQFENTRQKLLTRRVSPRYFSLIVSHCDLLFDLVRGAEEVNTAHNTHIVSLNLNLSIGTLPG